VSATPSLFFRLYAVATLPSGRVLTLTLEGPGQFTRPDLELLERVAKTISTPSEPAPPSASDDAFDILKYRSVISPLTLAQSGDFASPSASSPTSPSPSSQPVSAGIGALNIIYTDADQQVATFQILPIYLPALPPEGPTGDVPDAGSDDEPRAFYYARLYANSHDSALNNLTLRRVTRSRILLTPERRVGTVIRAMTVSSESSPLAALIVGRAPVSMENALTRLLNRAADRLTFDRRTDDISALVAAGSVLSQRSLAVSADDSVLIYRAFSDPSRPLGLTRYSDGTITSRRVPDELHPLAAATRTASRQGNLTTLTFSQSIRLDNSFQEVYRTTSPAPDLPLSHSPEDATLPSSFPAAPSSSASDPYEAIRHAQTYIPGPRLFPALATATSDPVLLVTDHLPGLDTLRYAPPRFWLVLAVPLARSSVGATQTILLHPLASPYTLLARYQLQPGNPVLTAVDVPPFFQAVPLPPDHPIPSLPPPLSLDTPPTSAAPASPR
jgi:hypothetical protein